MCWGWCWDILICSKLPSPVMNPEQNYGFEHFVCFISEFYGFATVWLWAHLCHWCFWQCFNNRESVQVWPRVYKLCKWSCLLTIAYYLSEYLTAAACLKGYDGVKSRANCWPAALRDSVSVILFTWARKRRETERWRRHLVNIFRYSNV